MGPYCLMSPTIDPMGSSGLIARILPITGYAGGCGITSVVTGSDLPMITRFRCWIDLKGFESRWNTDCLELYISTNHTGLGGRAVVDDVWVSDVSTGYRTTSRWPLGIEPAKKMPGHLSGISRGFVHRPDAILVPPGR